MAIPHYLRDSPTAILLRHCFAFTPSKIHDLHFFSPVNAFPRIPTINQRPMDSTDKAKVQRHEDTGDLGTTVRRKSHELRLGTGNGDFAKHLPPMSFLCRPVAGTEEAIDWAAQRTILREILQPHGIFRNNSDAYIEGEL